MTRRSSQSARAPRACRNPPGCPGPSGMPRRRWCAAGRLVGGEALGHGVRNLGQAIRPRYGHPKLTPLPSAPMPDPSVDATGVAGGRRTADEVGTPPTASPRTVRSGRRVAVFAENAAESVIAHLGGLRSGASVVAVNSHLAAPEAAYQLTAGDVAVLIAGPAPLAERRAAAGSPAAARCTPGTPPSGRHGWPRHPPVPRPTTCPSCPTCSSPRAPPAPPRPRNCRPTCSRLGRRGRRSWMPRRPTGSWAWAGTWWSPPAPHRPLNRASAGGGHAHRRARPVPPRAGAGRHRGVADRLVHLGAHPPRPPRRPRWSVASLRLVFLTGAACPEDVKRAIIDWWGPVLLEAYGATEVGVTASITSEDWLDHPGSVGRRGRRSGSAAARRPEGRHPRRIAGEDEQPDRDADQRVDPVPPGDLEHPGGNDHPDRPDGVGHHLEVGALQAVVRGGLVPRETRPRGARRPAAEVGGQADGRPRSSIGAASATSPAGSPFTAASGLEGAPDVDGDAHDRFADSAGVGEGGERVPGSVEAVQAVGPASMPPGSPGGWRPGPYRSRAHR